MLTPTRELKLPTINVVSMRDKNSPVTTMNVFSFPDNASGLEDAIYLFRHLIVNRMNGEHPDREDGDETVNENDLQDAVKAEYFTYKGFTIILKKSVKWSAT